MCKHTEVRMPAQLNTPPHIAELFLNMAGGFSIKSVELSVRNGGLTLIRMRANGRGGYGEQLLGVMRGLAQGRSGAGYRPEAGWQAALVYLSGCSEWRFACYDERDALWHAYSSIQGEWKEERYPGEPGYELTVINAFSNVPEIYRSLERDYIQTMHIAGEVRRFCLENTRIALKMENNGKLFFRIPGDGTIRGCLTHLFSKPITHQLKETRREANGLSMRAMYLPSAIPNVERDLAVVYVNAEPLRSAWVLPALQRLYRNDFSSRHFIFTMEVEMPGHRALGEAEFGRLLSGLAIQPLRQVSAAAVLGGQDVKTAPMPPFLAPCGVEQAVLPDVRGTFQVEKAFGRFFLIRQDCWLYLFDYMEVLTRLRMTEIAQEYQSVKILVTACSIPLKPGAADGHIDTRQRARCAQLGFAFDEAGERAPALWSYPYYLKANLAPSIAENLLCCLGERPHATREDLLYVIAYGIVCAENINRGSAACENVVMLLEMAHRLLQDGLLPRESIPVYRIGCNAYDRHAGDESRADDMKI